MKHLPDYLLVVAIIICFTALMIALMVTNQQSGTYVPVQGGAFKFNTVSGERCHVKEDC